MRRDSSTDSGSGAERDGDRGAVLFTVWTSRRLFAPELAGMNNHEAQLAGELAVSLCGNAVNPFDAPRVGDDFLFFVLVLVVSGGDAILEDGVEVGLDVVVVLLVLFLVIVTQRFSPRGFAGTLVFVLVIVGVVDVVDLQRVVLVIESLVIVLVELIDEIIFWLVIKFVVDHVV
jgi:hypothetical protein